MQGVFKTLKVILLVLLIGFASGCSLKKSSTTETSTAPAVSDFVNQESIAVMAKTQENLAKAKTEATNWKKDAVFVGYNFKVPPDLDPKSLTETFVFGTSSEENYWWTYSIDSQGKVVRAMILKEDYLGKDLQPIQEQYWKKSYVEAIKTAESNGGLTFRSQNPEAEITLVLSQTAPNNWLWYVIEYRGVTSSQKIRISANDGKVYNEQGTLIK